jgi:hypothetical protein
MDILFIPEILYECGEWWWNDIDRGKPKNLDNSYSSATLPTTNPTRIGSGVIPVLRCEKPATAQSAARNYTDWATQLTYDQGTLRNFIKC